MAAINQDLDNSELIAIYQKLTRLERELDHAMEGIYEGTTQPTYVTNFVTSVLDTIKSTLGERELEEHL